jgi:DNA-binding FadR family transcriptional regulator
MVHAVVSGDAARAEMHAARHLESIRDHVLEHSPDPKGQRPRWTMPAAGHTQDQKLAEVVAQRILSEITGGGWPIGSVIGSEAALLERFEVSRAVLREAVRLLEYHSVARMRRGPGGGLVVAEPDPSASIEAMALYLDYQGIEIDHLRVVREAVELDCVQRVASRVDDAEVAGRLRGLTRPGGAADGVNGVHPGPGGDRQHYRMHLEMAEQAGNPVLALFLRILLTLWARQQNDGPGADPADTTTGLAHDGIVDALLRGDRDLARHRMRRHLDALTRWWQ